MSKLVNKILFETKLGEQKPSQAAGVLIICPSTKRALINKRGPDCDQPNSWACFAGGVDDTDASIEDCIKRELMEEAGFEGAITLQPSYIHREPNFIFHNYIGFVTEEFKPILNEESSDYAWCNWQTLWEIEPKHPGFDIFLNKKGNDLRPFFHYKTVFVEKILKEAISNTMEFYHGGNLDDYSDLIAQKNGRYESGPGLYLTADIDTARKYAKGNRKLYKITIKQGNDLSNSKIPVEACKNFIKQYVVGSKKKMIWERISKYINNGFIPANNMNVIILNEKAIQSTKTIALRQFWIDNNIDYEMSTFAGYDLCVLFNMKKIIKTEKI